MKPPQPEEGYSIIILIHTTAGTIKQFFKRYLASQKTSTLPTELSRRPTERRQYCFSVLLLHLTYIGDNIVVNM